MFFGARWLMRQQILGRLARQLNQRGIHLKICITQERHTGLASANELAGATQM